MILDIRKYTKFKLYYFDENVRMVIFLKIQDAICKHCFFRSGVSSDNKYSIQHNMYIRCIYHGESV